MRKIVKIILSLFIILVVTAIIFGIVDINRAHSGKRPIFCMDKSGGSIILYVGPGYIIDGAWDDHPGGLEHTKIHTWIGWFIENL